MVKKWTHTRGSICICIWVSVYLSICGSTRAHVSVSVSVNVAVSVSAALACVYNTHFKSRWLWHWVSSALSQRTQSRRRPQRRRQRTPTEAAGLGFRGGTMDDGARTGTTSYGMMAGAPVHCKRTYQLFGLVWIGSVWFRVGFFAWFCMAFTKTLQVCFMAPQSTVIFGLF